MRMVSVIIPIYNVEKYLAECIESVCNQTYKDIEIILIDDGSTDGSYGICEVYKEKDSRIVVIHKQNGGHTSARKAGIIAAKGKFVACVDADDRIEPEYLEQLVAEQERNGAQMVATGYYYEIDGKSQRVMNVFQSGVYDNGELLPKALYAGQFFEYGILPHMWNKLFEREMLLNIQMCIDERILIGEDAAVVYSALLECGRICVSDACGYHHVKRPASITQTVCANEIERIEILLSYLENVFAKRNVLHIMSQQLEQYKKYLLLLRQPEFLFKKEINPFGEIPSGSRIVIYCAGVLGKRLYNYFSDNPDVEVVGWLDQNYETYRKEGFPVSPPQDITGIQGYDAVIIANITYTTAKSIRRYLKSLSVEDEKIRWFSEQFLNEPLGAF